ncbi:hypothetical protein GTA62_14050 [Roseobacter sp. HKCCD9010]|uniref:hypothetical protein n=1 Tax=unclassified Roseobacter TaxID=196798 RepID=UPI001490D7A1|nr:MULTISPECIES: hypothetical protein [unclassified Roseobacter]MBF9050766.1 hypothetical protein [Rhodobacterales bacterium HKCCD4356]NNV11816.1 hypothetical protein [Roseobacter sp. HKCCD7357]NNV17967.1 hypothetical protein [Roseobacter sp. HKCCD8768]NNV26058.1 hypothetical protein [Roseobacter sp. HKCCD8192]NNV31694.1 hypothetical protein [Roseobacter sp. HKCCD9061]
MTFRLLVTLTLILGVAACSTRLNPFNWFGNDREERVEIVETVTVVDPRPLVSQVISLNVDPHPGGAIIRAMGLPPRQGYWAADLVEVERAEGRLVFEFRVFEPPVATREGTQRSREILAGTELSTQELDGVRTIVVQAQSNRRSVSRR